MTDVPLAVKEFMERVSKDLEKITVMSEGIIVNSWTIMTQKDEEHLVDVRVIFCDAVSKCTLIRHDNEWVRVKANLKEIIKSLQDSFTEDLDLECSCKLHQIDEVERIFASEEEISQGTFPPKISA